MRLPRLAAIVIAATVSSTAALAQMPPPPLPQPGPSAAGACTIVGPVLSPVDFNVPAGQPVADASAVALPDGRLRMYVFAQGRGVVSAVSVAPDGLAFVPEAGNRLPDGSGMPRSVVNPAGGWRLFFIGGDGIRSAVSRDGLTFTVEAGFRISREAGLQRRACRRCCERRDGGCNSRWPVPNVLQRSATAGRSAGRAHDQERGLDRSIAVDG